MITIEEFKNKISKKSRLLGLDLGSKRIGVAISDDLLSIATPFKTINKESKIQFIDELKLIIKENNIKGIIVGNPIHMDGSLSRSSQSVKDMCKNCDKPIIMPLSNPTSKSEAEPKDLIHWSDGKALVAAGSPFDPVDYKGRKIRISQGNNAFVFPGLGLGVIASKAKRMSDKMIIAAAPPYALSNLGIIQATLKCGGKSFQHRFRLSR